jgi:hypothetical protein
LPGDPRESLKQLPIKTGGTQNLENAIANVELALDDSGCFATSRARLDVVFEDKVLHVALNDDPSTLECVSAPGAMSWQSNHENYTVVAGGGVSSEALGVQFADALPDGVMFRESSRAARFRRMWGVV